MSGTTAGFALIVLESLGRIGRPVRGRHCRIRRGRREIAARRHHERRALRVIDVGVRRRAPCFKPIVCKILLKGAAAVAAVGLRAGGCAPTPAAIPAKASAQCAAPKRGAHIRSRAALRHASFDPAACPHPKRRYAGAWPNSVSSFYPGSGRFYGTPSPQRIVQQGDDPGDDSGIGKVKDIPGKAPSWRSRCEIAQNP